MPPITSTTMSISGSDKISSALVVSTPSGSSTSLTRNLSRTRTFLRFTVRPVRPKSDDPLLRMCAATPAPTTPRPIRPTLIPSEISGDTSKSAGMCLHQSLYGPEGGSIWLGSGMGVGRSTRGAVINTCSVTHS